LYYYNVIFHLSRERDSVAEFRRPQINQNYGIRQLSVAGKYLAHTLTRVWFDGIFDRRSQPHMVRLLVGVFEAYSEGLLPTKMQIMKAMGVVDARTSQRYIGLAVDLNLLTVEPSTLDQRVELLCPTEKLLTLVRRELAKVADELQLGAQALSATFDLEVQRDNPFYSFSPVAALQELYDSSWQHRVDRFSETIRLSPENLEALRRRAEAYAYLEAHDKALADYAEIIRVDPVQGYSLRGDYHGSKGQLESAIADYTEALQLTPKDSWLYFDRAELYDLMDRFEEAISDYSAAINNCSEENAWMIGPYLEFRATANERKGDVLEAIADTERAMQLGGEKRQYLASKLSRLRVSAAAKHPGSISPSAADESFFLRLEPVKDFGELRVGDIVHHIHFADGIIKTITNDSIWGEFEGAPGGGGYVRIEDLWHLRSTVPSA
jgi:tetratricopeptide (TPR) repeat protein